MAWASQGDKYRHNVDRGIYVVQKVSGNAVVLKTPSNLEIIVNRTKLTNDYTKL